MNSKDIYVDLDERSYEIKIEAKSRFRWDGIPEIKNHSNLIVLTDENVYKLYKNEIDSFDHNSLLVLPPGEKTKSFHYLQMIWDKMVELKLDRKSLLIVVGGGVLGDISGFAASTYMRGIDFVQIPTTLLSQVDSSVGGKVAINHPNGKNLIGNFYQPKSVYIDPEVLKTLPKREFDAGLCEVLKYGVIWDELFFQYLFDKSEEIHAHDSDTVSQVIGRCCEIKAEVVKHDERETGLREILNYGHSIAHGLENVLNYEGVLHGEAVLFGMDVEMNIAVKRGLLDICNLKRQRDLFAKLNLSFCVPKFSMNAYLEAITLDKKNTNGKLVFMLPEKIGKVKKYSDVTFDEIKISTMECLNNSLFK